MRTIITPDMAKEILENNKKNRPINDGRVSFLENQIKTNKFVYNGSTIVISKDGDLVDGQHRLMACINTNTPIDIELIDNVDFSVFKTIDTGKPRSGGDVFAINGIANQNNMSAICNQTLITLGLSKKTINNKTVKYSHDELLTHFEKYGDKITKIYSMLKPLYDKTRLMPPAFSVSLAHILDKYIGDRRGTDFIRQVYTGVQETDSNIPLVIKDRLVRDGMSNSGKLSKEQKRNMIINGFKAYVDGKSYKQIPSTYYNIPKDFKVIW